MAGVNNNQTWQNLCICSNINKLVNFENTFKKLLFNQLPYSLWMTIVIFIDKAHSWKNMTEFERK